MAKSSMISSSIILPMKHVSSLFISSASQNFQEWVALRAIGRTRHVGKLSIDLQRIFPPSLPPPRLLLASLALYLREHHQYLSSEYELSRPSQVLANPLPASDVHCIGHNSHSASYMSCLFVPCLGSSPATTSRTWEVRSRLSGTRSEVADMECVRPEAGGDGGCYHCNARMPEFPPESSTLPAGFSLPGLRMYRTVLINKF